MEMTLIKQWPEFGGYKDVKMYKTQYVNGGLAIQLTCDGGGFEEPLMRLSIYTEDSELLPADQFIAKTYSENEELAGLLFDTGLFEDTQQRIGVGYTLCPIWRLKP